jgi:NhaP-type Na+/H+ or K+/H+ antiporter
VGRKEVPHRLRHLLNVESGLNDGLALPVVIVLLAVASHHAVHTSEIMVELGLGVVLGVVIPWAALSLERSRFFAATQTHKPLMGFAIGLLLFALTSITHANAFLAAFAAGVTVATIDPSVRDAFHEFGELLAELFKLAALLVFGALISPAVLRDVPWSGYLFAVLILVLVRPLALLVALPPTKEENGERLSRREWLAAAWFGPKGFASAVYGLLVLQSGIPGAEKLFHLIAICIVLSILAHSSTDVIVARWFQDPVPTPPRDDEMPQAKVSAPPST